MPLQKTSDTTTITIGEISVGVVNLYIVGRSPLIFNCMSAKSKQALLLPEAMDRKSKAGRAASGLKHEPMREYRDSVYSDISPSGPTRLVFPASAFKKEMSSAALDLPNAHKSEIGRLIWVRGVEVAIWGVPQISMMVVRNSDMNKTPDIRTRAILPEWCCQITVEFLQPNLSVTSIVNLESAAGLIRGIGDGRQEKGTFSFGQHRLVQDETDPDYQRIVAEGGRAAQDAALEHPVCYDSETIKILGWYNHTVPKIRNPAAKSKAA